MDWFYLIVAGLLETAWAVMLKKTEGFTRLVREMDMPGTPRGARRSGRSRFKRVGSALWPVDQLPDMRGISVFRWKGRARPSPWLSRLHKGEGLRFVHLEEALAKIRPGRSRTAGAGCRGGKRTRDWRPGPGSVEVGVNPVETRHCSRSDQARPRRPHTAAPIADILTAHDECRLAIRAYRVAVK